MGWKIGTIGLGLTALGFAFWNVCLIIATIEQERRLEVAEAKNEGLEAIIDIQSGYLSDKN